MKKTDSYILFIFCSFLNRHPEMLDFTVFAKREKDSNPFTHGSYKGLETLMVAVFRALFYCKDQLYRKYAE